MTDPDDWQNYIRAQIGPLLAGRNLSAGGSFETACDEIADALRPDYRALALAAASGGEASDDLWPSWVRPLVQWLTGDQDTLDLREAEIPYRLKAMLEDYDQTREQE